MRDVIETHRPRGIWLNQAVWALTVYYYGVWTLDVRFPPLRWLTAKIYYALNLLIQITTGVNMDRSMQVPGKGFFIHHVPVWIHPDVKLGERVNLMHYVSIGTNMRSDGGCPVVGNDVFVGTGAVILGKVKVGDGARIGANSLVINNVPPGAFAVGVPAKNIMMPSVREQEAKRAQQQEG